MMIITVQLAGCFHMGSACDGQLDAVGRVPVLNASAGMQCIRLGWRVTLYLLWAATLYVRLCNKLPIECSGQTHARQVI